MSGAEMKKRAKRFAEECWNQGSLGFMDEFLDPKVVTHRSGREDLIGVAAFKQWIQDHRTDCPDFHVTFQEIIAEGDTVADRWTVSATFTGPGKLFPVPGTGKKMILDGTWFAHFVNGRVVENWYTFDLMNGLQQLGLMPPSGGAN